MSLIETEIKLPVKDIGSVLRRIRQVASHVRTEYIRDVIFGGKGLPKIRLRYQDFFGSGPNIEAVCKQLTHSIDNTKSEVERLIYSGDSEKEALTKIQNEGDYQEENSYEKLRISFKNKKSECCVTLDIYPFGAWLEIEGNRTEDIWETAARLGFQGSEAIVDNADELYIKWIKKAKLKELWDVRFGLNFRNL